MESLENPQAKVFLKKGREKSVKNFHPWIFSGAIEQITGHFSSGDIVALYSTEGNFLAKGFINPSSQIRIRILSFEEESITPEFFIKRLQTAFHYRRQSLPPHTTAYRVVHGDGDYLSGLVIDKYDDVYVLQIFSRGMDRLRPFFKEWMEAAFGAEMILERSENLSLSEEGITGQRAVLNGTIPPTVGVEENGIKFVVDLWEGQKTGFYLDQRDNRQRMAEWAAGKSVLNCFSYSGGFSVAAALKGAITTSVDISERALEFARKNFMVNYLDPEKHRFVVGNVFEFLRQDQEHFEVIILDPPAFIKKKTQLTSGARAYKEINRLAMNKLPSNGLLLSCSCSSHLSWDLFQKIIFSAAQESKKKVQIIGRYGQPADHPINIYHPESEYLKSFLLRIA